MSRVEENAKLRLPNSFRDDIQVQIAQAKFLEDISRSLAVIADHCLNEDSQNQPREESKSGYWIVDHCYSYRSDNNKIKWRYVLLCSECGMVTDITTNKPDSIPVRCCPNCGATMVLREEDKDRAASLTPAPVDPM